MADTAKSTYEKMCNLSGEPNVHHHIFTLNGKRYTFNRDFINHPDSSITGWLFAFNARSFLTNQEDFKIEPNGYIKFGTLKKYALKSKIIKMDK